MHFPPLLGTAAFLLWASLLIWFVPATFYWRDSAEFIITAFALDIAHPAGYPLYAQLANLFALLPIGNIPFRVNYFSLVCAALLLTFSSAIIYEVFAAREKQLRWFALVPPLVLLQSLSFLRQSMTAEVYMLHATGTALLLLLLWRHVSSRDPRPLVTASFVAGLLLGNHVSLVLSIVAVTVCVALQGKRFIRIAIPCLLAGIWGCAIYGYLPFRASPSLPLNTGAPYTTERAANLMSDARDRALKPEGTSQAHGDVKNDFALPLSNIGAFLEKDLGSLRDELPLPILFIACLGMILFFTFHASYALALSGTALGSWIFFHGWQPDPWIVLFLFIALAFTAAFAGIAARATAARNLLTVVAILLSVILAPISSRFQFLGTLAHDRRAEAFAERLLESTPSNLPLVVEASWFSALHAHYIQGIRPDVVPIYQPRLLFPYYFEPMVITRRRSILTTWMPEPRKRADPDIATISRFINAAAPVALEPNVVINSFLKGVLQLNEDGSVSLLPGKSFQQHPGYLASRMNFYRWGAELLEAAQPEIRRDAQTYFESLLINDCDLLYQTGQRAMAANLLQSVCERFSCSTLMRQNLKTYNSSNAP